MPSMQAIYVYEAVVVVAVAAAASEDFTLVRKGAEIDRVTNNQCQASWRFTFMKASAVISNVG